MLLVLASLALQYPERPPDLAKRAHTYSIVAYDSATGDLGVAVQSKFPNVGGIVPWAQAGVGAVATQSLGNTDYGEKGLELLARGATAPEALRIVMRGDPRPAQQIGRAHVELQSRLHLVCRLLLGKNNNAALRVVDR